MISDRTGRIAKNTLLLYVQTLLAMFLALYTSRVLLDIVGVEDYGLYNVVGGLVVIFSLISSSMAASTSRFLTFELGKGNQERLSHIFSTAFVIHVIIGLIVVALLESVGLWFLLKEMQIPEGRQEAAIWVFHCSVAGVFIGIINTPYIAVITAYERFYVFTYFALIDLLLKLLIVFLIQYIHYDQLKVYAVLFVLVQIVVQQLNRWYGRRYFQETRKRFVWNKKLTKEMTSFAGWSMFDKVSFMMYTQGLNLILNLFFGTTINAARGIAVQVQGLVIRLIGNFQHTIQPQITKSYATGDRSDMHRLVYSSSKFSFCLLLLMSIPIFFETQFLLNIWLTVVPEHTIIFVRIMLLVSFVECFANPLNVSAYATGKIKTFNIVTGGMMLVIMPVAYLLLKLGFPPESVFLTHLSIALITQLVRMVMVKSLIGLSLVEYWQKVLFKSLLLFVIVSGVTWGIYSTIEASLIRFGAVTLVSTTLIIVLTYFLVMNADEKQWFQNVFRAKLLSENDDRE